MPMETDLVRQRVKPMEKRKRKEIETDFQREILKARRKEKPTAKLKRWGFAKERHLEIQMVKLTRMGIVTEMHWVIQTGLRLDLLMD